MLAPLAVGTRPRLHVHGVLQEHADMQDREPYRFAFIRNLCPHLSDEELSAADARFAAYLDVAAQIAARLRAEESRFDKTERAPQDLTPPKA